MGTISTADLPGLSLPSPPINESLTGVLQTRLREQRASITESVDYQYAYNVLRNQFRDSMGVWRPTGLYGTRQSRVQGKNLYTNWNEFDLLRQVDIARTLDATNPIAQSIVNKLVSFVLQSGASYNVVSRSKLAKPPAEYLVRGQDELDTWQDKNKWKKKEKEHVRQAIVDGELLIHKGRDSQGEPTCRRFEPEQLFTPPGAQIQHGWRLGVQHEPGDVCRVLGYNINWLIGLPNNPKPGGVFVPADFVVHYKRNVVESVARGVSDFFSNADDLEKVDRALDALGAGTIARSKIAYFRKHKDALPGAVRQFRDAAATETFVNPLTQQQEKRFNPSDGTVADVPDTVDVATMPQGNTLEAIQAISFIVRICIGNRWDAPEFVISADASNNNYASILVAGSPFVLSIRQNQTDFADIWRECMEWVLRVRIAQGRLPVDFFDYCKVEVTLPDPVIANELEAEQIRDIRVRNKVLSLTTYSSQVLLNRDDEVANMQEELAQDPSLNVQPLPQLDSLSFGQAK